MENADPNIARVQHVAKSSSDQLLRKFAEVGSDSEEKTATKKELILAKRLKRSKAAERFSYGNESNSMNYGSVLAERKSLLAPAASSKKMGFIRKLGMSKSKARSKDLKSKSVIAALEKTWRRTVEGASRVLMEKHYNRHKRLINDVY